MLFKSQVYTQASGSIGGVTYSRNKGGMYTRARAIPTNPNSPRQAAVRAAMANLVVQWGETLTQAQRDIWIDYAANVTVTNRLGEQVHRSAQQMFLRGCIPRVLAGLDLPTFGPFAFDLGFFTEPTLTIDTANDEVDVAFEASDPWANEDGAAMIIQASRPQNPTVEFFKGPYQTAGYILGDGTTPPTSPAAITLPFAVQAGQRVFFRVSVTREDGRLSAGFRNFDDAA